MRPLRRSPVARTQRPHPVHSGRPTTPSPRPPPRYTRCEVTKPANDLTFHGVEPVMASVMIEPMLQSGHRLQVLLNGSVLPAVGRQSHQFQFRRAQPRCLHAGGERARCNGGMGGMRPAITFTSSNPRLLSPARQQQAKPPPVKPPPPAGPCANGDTARESAPMNLRRARPQLVLAAVAVRTHRAVRLAVHRHRGAGCAAVPHLRQCQRAGFHGGEPAAGARPAVLRTVL